MARGSVINVDFDAVPQSNAPIPADPVVKMKQDRELASNQCVSITHGNLRTSTYATAGPRGIYFCPLLPISVNFDRHVSSQYFSRRVTRTSIDFVSKRFAECE